MTVNSNHNWISNLGGKIRQSLRWLTPGLGVKRWLLLVMLGITFLGVGLAILLLDIYRTAPETWWLPIISFASLRFLPRFMRAIIFGGIGVSLIIAGIWGINRSLMAPFLKPGSKVVDAVAGHRRDDAAGCGSRNCSAHGSASLCFWMSPKCNSLKI